MEVGTDYEMATSLISATVTRSIMINSETFGHYFPDNYLNDDVQITQDELVKLSMYNVKVIAYQKKLSISPEWSHQATASGLLIWAMSIRSITITDCFPYGRHIWCHLLRGKSGWIDGMNEIGHFDTNTSQTHVDDLYPVPKLLAPQDDGPPSVAK